MIWCWYTLFGLGIGILSGVLGIGGGVLLIPGLVLLFGFSQAEAQGTSLAVLIPPIGIFAAIVYYFHGFVRLPVVGFVASGFMVGAFLGAMIVPQLSPTALRFAFGILLLYVGSMFIVDPSSSRVGIALPLGMTALSTVFLRIIRQRIDFRNERHVEQ